MNKPSKALRKFLIDWQKWVSEGAIDTGHRHSFTPHSGLCTNLHIWCARSVFRDYTKLSYELSELFVKDGLSDMFPFNNHAAGIQYIKEHSNGTMHLNEARKSWVRDKINGGHKGGFFTNLFR